jgi:N-acetylglucosaminyldiphosphoundecaprenol N-acetyl-beta-D-mannosaminyltransferase
LEPEQLFSSNGGFRQVVTVNAEIFVLAHKEKRLKRLLGTTVNTVDGRVLQWICMLLYPGKRIVLLKGADFIYDLAAWCQTSKQRLLLIGSTEASNAGAVVALRAAYPDLEVAGYAPPLTQVPFDPSCRQAILERIRKFRPHQLVICFGSPQTEFWIEENSSELAALDVHRAYSLGGTIDFVSGVLLRAPRFIQFIGTEWLFRLICEPRRRFRRTMIQFQMPFHATKTDRKIRPLYYL